MDDIKFINDYIDKLNEDIEANLHPTIQETKHFRYPLYSNCVSKSFYIWIEFFSELNEEQKKLHIIHAYSLLLATECFGEKTTYEGHESYNIKIDPNKIAKIICKLKNIKFRYFEELQREIYEIKEKTFPFPDSSHYKTGDIIRSGLSKFMVNSVFCEDRIVMVQAQSLNSFDNMSKTITCPETELMNYYRIVNSVEFSDNK